MDIFDVLQMIGGLCLFLFGMETMGDGLTRTSGSKLESILGKLTSSVPKGVLLGAVVTAVIQSSSATTVMLVGFVNSGIMKLAQAIPVIMGANNHRKRAHCNEQQYFGHPAKQDACFFQGPAALGAVYYGVL